jgi:glycosyltransferase involved in cell wall biosynthesis
LQVSPVRATAQDPPNITILMATYNGGRFLEAQLQSLTEQTHAHWELLARDDGSTDDTVGILQRFAARDARVRLVEPDRRRLGVTSSFGALLEAVKNETLGRRYVMFCDQDDVWRPRKVAISLRAMQEAEAGCAPDTPVLVHTDFDFVDERLAPLGTLAEAAHRLSLPQERILNRLLSQNFIYGCTMMLNRPLVEACTPIPPVAEHHDYWVALVAAATGHIEHLRERTVLYRQHQANVTPGIQAAGVRRRIRRLLLGWRDARRTNQRRYAQAEALARSLRHRLPSDKREVLERFLAAMARSRLRAACFAYRNGLSRQGPLQTALYLATLLATPPGAGAASRPHPPRSPQS